MSKEIYISSTPQETRLAIVEKDELAEIYYERENEYTLAGSIYNGRVTRVLPGMQSSLRGHRPGARRVPLHHRLHGRAGRCRGLRCARARARTDAVKPATAVNLAANVVKGVSAVRPPARRSPAPSTATEEEPVSLQGEAEGPTRAKKAAMAAVAGADGEGAAADVESTARAARTGKPRLAVRTARVKRAESRDSERSHERPRRDSNREDAPGRHEGVRERFAPRGHTRGSSGDSGESIDINASAEPFILPGESLSKYRRGEETERKGMEPRGASAVSRADLRSRRPNSSLAARGTVA